MPLNAPLLRRIVILTGMSGAGLSTALKALEDIGYEAVDNLRLGLIPSLVEQGSEDDRPLAVAVDSRNAHFSVEELLAIRERLKVREDLDVGLVFLDSADETLQRRFSETRRRHPLALDRPVSDGIRRERELLWRLRDEADLVIDTSLLSLHELRRLLAGHFRIDTSSDLTLFITSFAYRHGVPREADLVFDVRFLANPHWDTDLRPLTGRDPDVADYIRRDEGFAPFMDALSNLLVPLLPRYQQEGKSYLTIAVGCSGGRHRSVFVVEELATLLAAHGYIVGLGHRDLDRSPGGAPSTDKRKPAPLA